MSRAAPLVQLNLQLLIFLMLVIVLAFRGSNKGYGTAIRAQLLFLTFH